MSEVKEETTVNELNEVLEEIVAPQEQEVERIVFWVDETHVKIKEVHYEIVEDYREGFELDAFNARYQDIFDKYEYIVGDWGHEKLRLKGFYESKNRLSTPDKDIAYLQDYIYEFCNFGCRYFVLKRDPNVKPVVLEDEGIPKRPKNKQQKRNNKRFNNERVEDKNFKGNTQKNNRFTPKKRNFDMKESPKQDFGLKEMTHKESLHMDNKQSSPQTLKNKRQGRNFSIKEVEQTKYQKNTPMKQKNNHPNKRFDIREKPQKRGK